MWRDVNGWILRSAAVNTALYIDSYRYHELACAGYGFHVTFKRYAVGRIIGNLERISMFTLDILQNAADFQVRIQDLAKGGSSF